MLTRLAPARLSTTSDCEAKQRSTSSFFIPLTPTLHRLLHSSTTLFFSSPLSVPPFTVSATFPSLLSSPCSASPSSLPSC